MTGLSLRQRLHLRHLAASTAPILVGPWRSELGFHSLYFQPWLAAWRQQFKIDPDRVFVVAPGGSAVWHSPCHQVELFDHLSMAQVRQGLYADAHEKGSVKQTGISAQDTQLLGLVAATLRLRRYHVLHPSLMYHAFTPWFAGQMSLSDATNLLTVEEKGGRRCVPLSVGAIPFGLVLPDKYLCVKFYARPTFPHREDLREWVELVIDKLAAKIPVVLLDTGLDADDHADFPVTPRPNVFSLKAHVTPQNNLAVQSAVLSRAKGFVGTYGGTMQLAVRMGIPSVGFYTEFKGTCYAHKLLVEYLAVQQGTSLYIGRPHDASFLSQVIGGL